ncbi:MAG: TIGR04076 family protein [Candidatus Nezhaarchaeales archaeon]
MINMYRLILEVKEVKGKCVAGYKVGDKIVVEEPSILVKESNNICLYAIGALLPYLTVAYREVPKNDWINQLQHLQCPDPINTVTFKISRKKLNFEKAGSVRKPKADTHRKGAS